MINFLINATFDVQENHVQKEKNTKYYSRELYKSSFHRFLPQSIERVTNNDINIEI